MSTKDALAVGAQVLVWQVVMFFVGANTIGVFVFMVGHQRGPLSPSSELALLSGWAAIFALQGFAPQIVAKLSSPTQRAFARRNRVWFALAAFTGPWLGLWVVRRFTTQQWWLQFGENGFALIFILVVSSTLLCTLGTALWRHTSIGTLPGGTTMRWNGQGELVCPLRGQSLESRLAAQRSVVRASRDQVAAPRDTQNLTVFGGRRLDGIVRVAMIAGVVVLVVFVVVSISGLWTGRWQAERARESVRLGMSKEEVRQKVGANTDKQMACQPREHGSCDQFLVFRGAGEYFFQVFYSAAGRVVSISDVMSITG